MQRGRCGVAPLRTRRSSPSEPAGRRSVAARVDDVDADALLAGLVVAELPRAMRAPCRRGPTRRRRGRRAACAPRCRARGRAARTPTIAPAVVDEPRHGVVVADRDVLDRAHAPADEALEQRPAGDRVLAVEPHAADVAAADVHAHVERGAAAAARRPASASSRKPGRRLSIASWPPGCRPWACRPCGTARRFSVEAAGEAVAVEDRDAVVGVREDAGGEQAGHARADDDRVLAEARRRGVGGGLRWRPWRVLRDGGRCASPHCAAGAGAPSNRAGTRPGVRFATRPAICDRRRGGPCPSIGGRHGS